MMRRAIVGTLVLVLVTTPASAQFAVIDPANLAQAILIVQRTQRHLEELQAQYELSCEWRRGSAAWTSTGFRRLPSPDMTLGAGRTDANGSAH